MIRRSTLDDMALSFPYLFLYYNFFGLLLLFDSSTGPINFADWPTKKDFLVSFLGWVMVAKQRFVGWVGVGLTRVSKTTLGF